MLTLKSRVEFVGSSITVNLSHAISLARKYKNIYELALCNQVAGNHYIRDMEQVEEGIKHVRAAIDSFEAWGALAAVTHLKAKIEKLEKSSKRR
jgi:hypothetical protein